MYRRQLIPVVLLLGVTFLSGCERAPKGMVPVYPCKITLTKGGAPVVNVGISLFANSLSGSYSVGGATDANGVAEISTSYGSYFTKGAPAGEFQVTVMEVPTIPDELKIPHEQLSQMPGPERDAHLAKVSAARAAFKRSVPFSFATPDSTPLKVTVAESRQGTEVSFEINDY